jgi:hypothetical protein
MNLYEWGCLYTFFASGYSMVLITVLICIFVYSFSKISNAVAPYLEASCERIDEAIHTCERNGVMKFIEVIICPHTLTNHLELSHSLKYISYFNTFLSVIREHTVSHNLKFYQVPRVCNKLKYASYHQELSYSLDKSSIPTSPV